MNAKGQPGLHPDADTLNAFAEQALPGAERARVLAHMADCEECRQVVYLARAAAQPEMMPGPAAQPEASKAGILAAFTRWRVALIPAAALASIGAVVFWAHLYRAPAPVQMANSVPPTAPPAIGVGSPAKSAEMESARPQAHAMTQRAGRREGTSTQEAKQGAAPPSPASGMGVAAGNGGAESPIHLDAHSAALARYSQPQAADARSEFPLAPPATVAPLPGPEAPLAISAEPAAPVLQSQTTPELAPQAVNGFALMRLAKRAKLPSGLNTVSSAALLNRLVALDSEGAVFLSQDGGKHWEGVLPQWTGKAVAVLAPPQRAYQLTTAAEVQRAQAAAISAQPANTNLEVEEKASSAPPPTGPRAAPTRNTDVVTKSGAPAAAMLFKLVTDRHQVWVSADGKLWREQ